jgi:hypothetical protein
MFLRAASSADTGVGAGAGAKAGVSLVVTVAVAVFESADLRGMWIYIIYKDDLKLFFVYYGFDDES